LATIFTSPQLSHLEENRELVAAESPDDVRAACRIAQAVRDGDEHGVVGGVTMGVVHRLEAVEMEVKHHNVSIVATSRTRNCRTSSPSLECAISATSTCCSAPSTRVHVAGRSPPVLSNSRRP
jgi:hypothetical protein